MHISPEYLAQAGALTDCRQVEVDVAPEFAFQPIRRIGGKTGWYAGNWLWSLRGVMDRMVGGIGLRRGRRDFDGLRTGDMVDCWRVEAFEPDRLLRLSLEMRIPGRAWLEFRVEPAGTNTTIRQTAIYHPGGVMGRVYWLLSYPAHQFIFAGMLHGISTRAKLAAAERDRVGRA